MSISAAHADAFFDEVHRLGEVWAVRDKNGFSAPVNADGVRSMPFWSLATRARKIQSTVSAYGGFEVVSIPLNEWRSRWLPGLERDGLLVGLNWSGARATGYDVLPSAALSSLAARESPGTLSHFL
ncbi:DUF2750 domain-containing protein [Arthrobacter sp. ISL-48]|uniref:DUF2750 domain-containing protein n=1 Tax=Arthrobacter sp. ISL-48 TaxID=2819110 RepID=UPI001BE70A40|nr:DUF2750 domain-containing protein [Arthrobacter sp. ISL-48]MBT2534461.1 DUF2750 domain-containing protein [Arthrobacter sp. ISL-48]